MIKLIIIFLQFVFHFCRHGGYVLDDFPRSRDQWTALQDKEIVIDEVICMQDNSEGGQYLLKRYYELNKEEIEAKITFRVEEEKRKQEELEEAARFVLISFI